MRTVKDGEERRREILVTARDLFIRKGYEHTSINDILKIVGIAKGTFYYYFASKEEVLEAIILDIVEQGAKKAEAIVKDTSIPLMKRIILAIMAQSPEFEGSEKIAEELHKVENALLERLYAKAMVKRLTPILLVPVLEGCEAGVFHIEYPEECVESILLMGYLLFDCAVLEWEKGVYPRKIHAFLRHVERMMGTKEGELGGLLQMFGPLS